MILPPDNVRQDPNAMTSTQVPADDKGLMTTGAGNPVTNNQTSQTAGYYGPVLLQDFHLIDKIARFDRERIPERVVHAKGAGAHGYFEVTKDISHLTCAKFLSQVGKRTPVFTRFSVVAGERGTPDTTRDVRGFSVKFYTEEGNWDMVGNNTPVFFIRDPLKFPDFIHTQKRDPRDNCHNPDMKWDFWAQVPESIHQVMILFSNRGTPDGYRFMHGFSSHTLALVKENGDFVYVKWHFRTNQGIKNLTAQKAAELEGTDADYATRDLFDAIEKGNYPSWTAYIQVFTQEEAMKLKYNPFDITKVVSKKDFPLHEVGRLVLDRNPENYFVETEQAAFSPSHMGRLFSYPDTHRHRLGANYLQLPINSPLNPVKNHQRDGFMCINNGGRLPNYEPNTLGGPHDSRDHVDSINLELGGRVGHHGYEVTEDDFDQPRALYHLLSAKEQQDLVDNFANDLGSAQLRIQRNFVPVLKRVDSELGKRVEDALKKMNQDY
ncbi:catalase [Coemansia spiralis]|nr:catalase [Coemansia spiralis]